MSSPLGLTDNQAAEFRKTQKLQGGPSFLLLPRNIWAPLSFMVLSSLFWDELAPALAQLYSNLSDLFSTDYRAIREFIFLITSLLIYQPTRMSNHLGSFLKIEAPGSAHGGWFTRWGIKPRESILVILMIHWSMNLFSQVILMSWIWESLWYTVVLKCTKMAN